MKNVFVTLAMIAFSLLAKSQPVERIMEEDVKISKLRPQCSGGNLTADTRLMPENAIEEIKIASYMRQFRIYRGRGLNGQILKMQFSDEKVKSDGQIREVTPNYFQLERTNSKTNTSTSHCISYNKIAQLVYDSGGTIQLYITR